MPCGSIIISKRFDIADPSTATDTMTEEPTYEELKEKIRELEKRLSAADLLGKQAFKDQQFLEILINTIPSPIFYKDSRGVYRHCNEAFATEILGLKRDQIINHSLFDLPDKIPVELAQRYYEKDKLLLEKAGTQVYKNEVSCADGAIRRFKFYKSTVLNKSGSVDGLVGIMLDITNMEANYTKLATENSELKSLSYIDALTGVLNRRKFESIFPLLLKGSEQASSILNFAVIDIDNFKQFNDTYGHPAGDEALKSVANSIENNLRRPDDYVFRIGGEEFCALFYSRNEADAMKIAEKIRTDVESLAKIPSQKEEKGMLTVSIGLLSIHSSTIDKLQIYEVADQLLYKAKYAGRNITMHKAL